MKTVDIEEGKDYAIGRPRSLWVIPYRATVLKKGVHKPAQYVGMRPIKGVLIKKQNGNEMIVPCREVLRTWKEQTKITNEQRRANQQQKKDLATAEKFAKKVAKDLVYRFRRCGFDMDDHDIKAKGWAHKTQAGVNEVIVTFRGDDLLLLDGIIKNAIVEEDE